MKMSTTQVFIELLITGFGGLIWILIIVFGFSGLDLEIIFEKEFSNMILFPISGIAYIIGILIDRLGYQLLSGREKKNMIKIFTTEEEQSKIPQMITFITENSERLTGKIDYNRSRLRLCRSWILNFFLVSISIIIYVLLNITESHNSLIVISITSLILCLLCYIVWRKLSKDYYINIQTSFKNLKKIKAAADRVGNSEPN